MQTVPRCKWLRHLLPVFAKFHTHKNISNPLLCFWQGTITQTKQSLRPFTAVQLIPPNIVPGNIYKLRSSEMWMLVHSKCESKVISGLLCEWWLGFSNATVEPHICVLGSFMTSIWPCSPFPDGLPEYVRCCRHVYGPLGSSEKRDCHVNEQAWILQRDGLVWNDHIQSDLS